MKEFEGHFYETVESWHPVVIRKKKDWMDNIVFLPSWLNEYCPDADMDYDAWVYADDNLMDDNHRTIYFFRDEQVALLFTLRWG